MGTIAEFTYDIAGRDETLIGLYSDIDEMVGFNFSPARDWAGSTSI